ncbi:MAG: DHA2 family efflux MFS transporter permease subunit [Proteobacteria bacterium]|nr:DHA2 family efflux MFS transporter permease subunit [Pseudomonadota bacterium]
MQPAHPPLKGFTLVLATAALGLASFMNILDLSIANVSVPTIAGDLGVSVTQGTWTITSYAVAEAIMLPLTGWLAGRFGQVRMFAVATLLFTLASAVCGMSVSFPMLLAARVLQGVFGASMIPLSQALMTSIYPPEKRGLAMGLWSMTTVVAPIAGPLAGGWLTENLSWHWIFLINLPVGLLVSLFAWELLAERETPKARKPVDYVGLALLVVGIGSLQILLDKGNELDWFGSPLIVTLACVSAVALTYFVIWEWYDPHPVVNLRLFTRRNFGIGVVCLLLGTVAFFGTVVILPLWLQTYHDYTPLWAGKAVAFGGVFAVILGPIVGANLHRIDARAVASFGFIVFAGTAFWSTTFTPDVDYWTVALTRLVMGIGISCFFLPLITINLSGLSGPELAGASGVSNFMRNLGSSFGTAAVTSLWDHRGIHHHAVLTEHITRQDPAALDYLGRLGSLGLSPEQALAHANREVTVQAYLLATNDVFLVSGVLMISLLGLIWWTRPPFTPASGAH